MACSRADASSKASSLASRRRWTRGLLIKAPGAGVGLECPRAETPCIVRLLAKAGNHRQRAAISSKTWCTEPSAMPGYAGYSVHHNFRQMAQKKDVKAKRYWGRGTKPLILPPKGCTPKMMCNQRAMPSGCPCLLSCTPGLGVMLAFPKKSRKST